MNRLISGGALLSTVFLIVGTYVFPGSMIMWFASLSLPYTIFRALMCVLLIGVLFTEPPRRLATRAVLGVLAAALAGMGIALSMNDSMHVLDIIVFMQLAFTFGVAALEMNEEEIEARVFQLQHPEQYVPPVHTMWPLVVRHARNMQAHMHRLQSANDHWQVV